MQLVAVSKTVPIERLRAALAAGFSALGENRVQEASPKVAALPSAEWHLVGHLQGNKAGRALELFSVIESVDSVSLAGRLARLSPDGRRVPIYLQVNVDDDPAKAGFVPIDLDRALDVISGLPALEVRGLMTVGHLVADPRDARPTFVALRRLSESLRGRHAAVGAGLSMGMSDDFEIAIEEGATLVRVGRAIFGERPAA